MASADGKALGVVARCRLENLDDRAMLGRMIEQLDRATDVVGPEHHVDVTGPIANRVAVLLRQAAAHCDLDPVRRSS